MLALETPVMEATSELSMSLLQRFYNIARSNLQWRGDAKSLGIDPAASSSAESKPVARDPPGAEYYANLELLPGASYSEIKGAYRRLLRAYHPDKHQSSRSKSQMAEEISKRLNEAMDFFEKEHEGGRI